MLFRSALWGLFAIAFALFASFSENLIEAINILGSLFYGVVLGMFLVAFFIRRVGGTAVFAAAIVAQALVIALYATLSISYLWYNLIGCAACVLLALGLRSFSMHPSQLPAVKQRILRTEIPTLEALVAQVLASEDPRAAWLAGRARAVPATALPVRIA